MSVAIGYPNVTAVLAPPCGADARRRVCLP
jgi:hypothetical protein